MTNLDSEGNWWGGEGRGENRLTMLDLISNDTLSTRLAALLWLMVENKTSILTAAGPQLAGKTTLLTALLDLAPPRYSSVLTRGRAEDFSFLEDTDPATTYVLVPELSDHTHSYLWGPSVRTLFDALEHGYSMAATMHADAPEEVAQMLRQPPVAIPGELLHHLGVVINIRMMYGERGMVRRVSGATLVEPGPKFVRLPTWNSEDGALAVSEPGQYREAVSMLLGTRDLDALLAQHQETLEAWLSEGPHTSSSFTDRIAEFYASNPSNTSV